MQQKESIEIYRKNMKFLRHYLRTRGFFQIKVMLKKDKYLLIIKIKDVVFFKRVFPVTLYSKHSVFKTQRLVLLFFGFLTLYRYGFFNIN